MSLRARHIVTATVIGLVALSGCGLLETEESKKDEFCRTFAEHTDRLQSSLSSAESQMDNPDDLGSMFSGLAQGISAIGDQTVMWDELAATAPDEIKADVEKVRDTTKGMSAGGDPVSALAQNLTSGLMSAGSTQRVDEYIDANC